MKKRKVILGIGSIENATKEFTKIWHQIEAGKSPRDAPIEKIHFENERLLFKTLTSKRCNLLRYMHEHGKITIRNLAKELHRDYADVQQDVKTLTHIGLIIKDRKSNKYYMPWDIIITEIPMISTNQIKQESHFKKRANS